jgi:tagatose-6-phosphate ketose/aldose isomerase
MDNLIQTNYLDKDIKIKSYTSQEISNQPDLWRQTLERFLVNKECLKHFLDPIYSNNNLLIILTGAGSSAFIGQALEGPFQKNTNKLTRAISTTDLVTHPDLFLQKDRATLLVSFARSGDSPESIAAVELINKLCSHIYHLIITCNPEGKLAREKNKKNELVFLLPPETNDKGLAMTASFTSMLLSGILISKIKNTEDLDEQVARLASYGSNILQNYSEKLYQISKKDFKRVVFLGSGPLLGSARESHLKLQELTNGRIICKHDSFLGLRHGPKAVINKSTLVIYLFSNRRYVRQYEDDLVSEICRQDQGMYSIGISENESKPSYCLGLNIILGQGQNLVEEEYLSVCDVLPAQILGYYKSLELGFNPDNPSESGVISRVVKGVKIYPY